MSVQLIQGNALQIPLADRSVHCCVTSPPYWGLRDYGVAGQLGLEPTFDEYLQNMLKVFAEVHRVLRDDGTLWLNMGDGYAASGKGLNGDGAPGVLASEKQVSNAGANGTPRKTRPHGNMKPKDLIGQPWALAFALRAAGWYLRSDIIWAKPAPMPESVTDRPTKSHEYLFLLSKREKYFFDQAAWLEPCTGGAHPRGDGVNPKAGPKDVDREDQGLRDSTRFGRGAGSRNKQNESFSAAVNQLVSKRNRRTVIDIAAEIARLAVARKAMPDADYAMWLASEIRLATSGGDVLKVGSQPTPEAHFATFPEALVEPCLLAGCPKYTCPKCGTGWQPIEEKTGGATGKGFHDHAADLGNGQRVCAAGKGQGGPGAYKRELKGYAPNCECTPHPEQRTPHKPGTAFDPFSGSGTVAAVANRMGYSAIGLELNEKYIEIARRRIFADVLPTPAEKKIGQRLAFT